jgi:hypothetical protein
MGEKELKDSPFTSGDESSHDVEAELTTIGTNIGHTEELRRDFSIWSLGSLCLCLMGTVRTFHPLSTSRSIHGIMLILILLSGRRFAALSQQR